MTKDDLAAEIRAAFADAAYPGDASIVTAFAGDTERDDIRDAFKGHSWQSVPNELLFYERGSLSFFSPAGLAYYLPAFLIYALNHDEESDSLPENLIFQLTLPTQTDVLAMAESIRKAADLGLPPAIDYDAFFREQLENHDETFRHFIERFSLFTREQGRVVKHFLEFMAQQYEDDFLGKAPAVAVERYWFQFD